MRATISAVVVNWNTADLLEQCLSSLHDHWPTDVSRELVVVDNGSSDGSVELVRSRWPDAKLITNDENLGYQTANNQGMAASSGQYLLLINADARLEPGSLTKLLRRFDLDRSAAAVAPRLVYGDRSFQRWTAGRSPSIGSLASFFLFVDRISKRAARRSLYLARDVERAFQPDWVSSACLLVSADAIEQVGPMDERYFAYMDDVELCQRLRAAGWTIWYEPRATAVHLMGSNAGKSTAVSPAAIMNLNDYMRRTRGPAAMVMVRLVEVTGFLARAIVYAARSIVDRTDWARARGHLRNARFALHRGRV